MAICIRFSLILLILTGCSRKAVTSIEYRTRVEVQRDTVELPVSVETLIPSPCDTNGILKDFKYETQVGSTNVSLKTDGTRIVVKLKTDTVWRSYKSVSDTLVITKTATTTKTVTPRWAWQLLVANVIVATGLIIYLYLRR